MGTTIGTDPVSFTGVLSPKFQIRLRTLPDPVVVSVKFTVRFGLPVPHTGVAVKDGVMDDWPNFITKASKLP
jgi:hypothetical protein